MDFLQYDTSVLCLAGAGGVLGYFYQSSRSRILAEPIATIVSEANAIVTANDIWGYVWRYTVTSTKYVLAPCYPSFWQDNLSVITDFLSTLLYGLPIKVPSIQTALMPLEASNKRALLVVFSFTGFLYVYATVSSFVRSNSCSSTPVFLLYDYGDFQCRRLGRVLNRDNTGMTMCLYASLIFVIIKFKS